MPAPDNIPRLLAALELGIEEASHMARLESWAELNGKCDRLAPLILRILQSPRWATQLPIAERVQAAILAMALLQRLITAAQGNATQANADDTRLSQRLHAVRRAYGG
jgi:hypothetical protein